MNELSLNYEVNNKVKSIAEEACFLRESVVNVDAAVVGISSSRWIAIGSSQASGEFAVELMSRHRFDILPIETSGETKEYFHTQEWGDYSSAVRQRIGYRDVIPCSTPLRNVIQAFAAESRDFYFLASERRISGLISLVNLNCRQVKVYLFSLLSELEIELGNLINRHCSESELLEMTLGPNGIEKDPGVKQSYDADKAKGVDVPFVEYLYLRSLLKIIRKKKLFDALGSKSASQFDEAFCPLVELRNAVAHPNRSLITNLQSCSKLWQRVDRIEGALFDLRRD